MSRRCSDPPTCTTAKGSSHYYSGHYTEAINDFDQTLSMSPDYPGVVDLKTSAANLRQQYGDVSVFQRLKSVVVHRGWRSLVLAAGGGLTFMVLRSRRQRLAWASSWTRARCEAAPEETRHRKLRLAPLTATEPHYCANCGAEHHPAEKFCPNCGKQVWFGESALGANRTR